MIHLKIWQTGVLIGCLLLSLVARVQEAPGSVIEQQTGHTASSKILPVDEATGKLDQTETESSAVDVDTAVADSSAQADAEDTLVTTVAEPILPHDLSAWGMFMQAD